MLLLSITEAGYEGQDPKVNTLGQVQAVILTLDALTNK